jgi:hypothetical protein
MDHMPVIDAEHENEMKAHRIGYWRRLPRTMSDKTKFDGAFSSGLVMYVNQRFYTREKSKAVPSSALLSFSINELLSLQRYSHYLWP